jgi:glycerophosphoryl diester phosphodiesterase
MLKQIIAHRGASNLARENTLEAFGRAIELGANYIELDVRKTKDGELVVYHYQILGTRLLRNCTYSRALEVAKKNNFQIPTLAVALELAAGKIKLDIELKEAGYEKAVLDLVLSYLQPEDFIITSFRSPVIFFVKKHYPQVSLGLIIDTLPGTIYDAIRYFEISFIADSLRERREAAEQADFLVFHQSLFGKLPNNKPSAVFTVDRPKNIERFLKQPGVFAIITNKPDLALKLRKQIYGT